MKRHILRRLARFLRPYALRLTLCLGLTVLSSLLSLAAPLLSGRAVMVTVSPRSARFGRAVRVPCPPLVTRTG